MEFITYSTNHTRPWLDLVDLFGISETCAEELFNQMCQEAHQMKMETAGAKGEES